MVHVVGAEYSSDKRYDLRRDLKVVIPSDDLLNRGSMFQNL